MLIMASAGGRGRGGAGGGAAAAHVAGGGHGDDALRRRGDWSNMTGQNVVSLSLSLSFSLIMSEAVMEMMLCAGEVRDGSNVTGRNKVET